MEFVYTDSSDENFVELCHLLDDYLNEIVGGEKQRSQYVVHNAIEEIRDVFVVYDEKCPIGCASFKYYDDKSAEVKRVYIKKEYRGKGISRQLMYRLEEKAKEKGFERLILETGEPLHQAMNLYKNIGFTIIPNYGPYKCMAESICMEKSLI